MENLDEFCEKLKERIELIIDMEWYQNEQISGIFKETLCYIGGTYRSISVIDNGIYHIFV